MSVKAKMKCVSIEDSLVKFECIYDQANSPEDNSFSKWTPYGRAEYGITNPDAHSQFEVGKFYAFVVSEWTAEANLQEGEEVKAEEEPIEPKNHPPLSKGQTPFG